MSIFSDIDFEQWSALALEDPQAFEALRSRAIDDFLTRIPPGQQQQRLRCLQWRIDQIRARSSNPMAACLSLYSMMWDGVTRRGGMLDALQGIEPSGPGCQPSAEIIDFPGTRPGHGHDA